MPSAKALEAATAVNSLLQFSASGQNACLAVIQVFFTYPRWFGWWWLFLGWLWRLWSWNGAWHSSPWTCYMYKIVGVHVQTVGAVYECVKQWRIQLGSEIDLEAENQSPKLSDREEEGLSTEQQVQEPLKSLSPISEIRMELRPCDTTEDSLLATFASVGCGCSKSVGVCSPTATSVTWELSAITSHITSLTWSSLDSS